ncbi:MAG: AzlC family ABC transporter permease [Acidimicrobiales bacterium]
MTSLADHSTPPTPEALRAASRSAVSLAVPLFIPAIPFAFVFGLAVRESPMPNGIGIFSSLPIFAGAAQLAMVTLLGTASVWAAGLAAVVINARHIMYSAAMAPAFKHQPRWFRYLGPFTLIDQVFALSEPRSRDHPDLFRRYYLVTSAIFLGGWVLATIAGLFFGSFIPDSWHLGYAPAVMFTGLVVMGLSRRPAVAAAIVGAAVCLLTIGLPNRVGLLIGAMAGVLAGLAVDLRLERNGAGSR